DRPGRPRRVPGLHVVTGDRGRLWLDEQRGDARRGLEPHPPHPDDQRQPRTGRLQPRGDDRRHRARRLPGDEPLLEHRRPPPQLPVRDPERMGDTGRQATSPGQERALRGADARVLAVLRRRRRPLRMEALGCRQLWQRAAGPGHPRQPRRCALPLPQRVGDGVVVMNPASPDDLLALADFILERVGRDGAEVTVVQHEEALTRFARNQIHQNVAESSRRVRLRLMGDEQVGVAEIRGEVDDLQGRLIAAAEAARELAPAGDVTPLPRPDAGSDGPVAHSAATAQCTPEWRAGQVGTVAAVSAVAGFEAFGALQTSLTHTAIANSQGVRRQAATTSASLICVARGENGWGYANRPHHDIRRLNAEEVAQEAVETCGRNQGATALDPGVYPVVLSPYAVADLVGHLADLGFSALSHQEHRSFMRPG